MSGSYLHCDPSPVAYGKYKSHQFQSDSEESFTSYSDKQVHQRQSLELKLPPRLSSTHNHGRENFDTAGTATDFTEATANLSIWEQWLVNKLQKEREQLETKKAEIKKAREEEQQREMEKEGRKIIAEKKHKEWLEEKLLKLKLKNAAEKRQKEIQTEINAEEAARLKADAEINFRKWMEKHNEIEHQRRLKEKKEKEKEINLKKERKQIAEEKYQQWIKDNRHRFAALHNRRTPSPSYINPVPWMGPVQNGSQKRPRSPPTLAPTVAPEKFHIRTFSAKCSSTPKPQARGLETHTPMRTGKAKNHASKPVGLVCVNPQLRFAGIRPISQYAHRKNAASLSCDKASARSSVPLPLNGMEKLSTYGPIRCKPR